MLDCEKPNKGEQLVKQFLNKEGYFVIDVSKDQHYWSQDIDFIAIKGDNAIKVEVKYDSWIHRTNNFFIELMADVDSNKCGWIDYCKADYLFYVDAIDNICYIITLDDIRDYLAKYPYKVKYCVDRDYFGEVIKRSQGALINVNCINTLYNIKIISLEY